MKKIIAHILVLVFSFSAFSQTVDDAVKLLQNEQPQKAKATLRTLFSKNSNTEAGFRLGNLYYDLGQKDSAKIIFNDCAKIDAKPNYCLAGSAIVLFDEGNDAAAQENINKLVSYGKSKDVKGYVFASQSYLKNDEPQKALSLLQRAVEIDLKNTEAQLALGDVYQQVKENGKAVTAYEYAIEAEPALAVAYMKIGQVYMGARNYEEALKNFQKGNEADPNFAPLYRELAEFNYYAKNYSEAVRLYKEYMNRTGSNNEKLSRYAAFLFLNKDYENAISTIENILKQDSSNVILSRLIGYSYYEQKKYPEGLSYMKNFFAKADPEKIIASDFSYYGKLLDKAGEDSLAVVYLKKAIEKEPENADAYEDAATVFYMQKKYSEAAEFYKKMISLKRASSQDFFQLGKAYYYSNNFAAADSAFAKVTQLQPTAAVGYLWRGRSNSQLDPESEKGLAYPFYQKVIELATDEAKYKKELVEAHSYLGFYYYITKNLDAATKSWKKVQELEPDNQQAKEYFSSLK